MMLMTLGWRGKSARYICRLNKAEACVPPMLRSCEPSGHLADKGKHAGG
jgi:hypothetical protein